MHDVKLCVEAHHELIIDPQNKAGADITNH